MSYQFLNCLELFLLRIVSANFKQNNSLLMAIFLLRKIRIHVIMRRHVQVRAQLFTSLMADLRQDMNGVSSFSRCLNGPFH